MKHDPIFTNLFDQTDFSEHAYSDLQAPCFSVYCDFQNEINVFQNHSDKIDDELFHNSPFFQKNAEFWPEEEKKIEERQSIRKNSMCSQDDPFVLTEFYVS